MERDETRREEDGEKEGEKEKKAHNIIFAAFDLLYERCRRRY